mmetsp:Transcript_8523/g.21238  ORF Transcript_8523/g.21238 Transcript_8523/m.21238 type:complete len:202 (-) Transcript_8523:599-1204(-)
MMLRSMTLTSSPAPVVYQAASRVTWARMQSRKQGVQVQSRKQMARMQNKGAAPAHHMPAQPTALLTAAAQQPAALPTAPPGTPGTPQAQPQTPTKGALKPNPRLSSKQRYTIRPHLQIQPPRVSPLRVVPPSHLGPLPPPTQNNQAMGGLQAGPRTGSATGQQAAPRLAAAAPAPTQQGKPGKRRAVLYVAPAARAAAVAQ